MVCGVFWLGVKDSNGIFDVIMSDGILNGYVVLLVKLVGDYVLCYYVVCVLDDY